jgi:hypothetical protein
MQFNASFPGAYALWDEQLNFLNLTRQGLWLEKENMARRCPIQGQVVRYFVFTHFLFPIDKANVVRSFSLVHLLNGMNN